MAGTLHAPRRTTRISVLISLILCAGMLVASAPPAKAEATTSEKRMHYYINHARDTYDRRAMALSWRLSDIARSHSKKMSYGETIFHTSNLAYAIRSISWTVCGENVGMGPTVSAIFKAFMNSAPHKAKILYRGFERVGVGIVWRSGMAYVTLIFADYP